MLLLERATKSVPAVRYGLGVGGLLAVVSLIRVLGINPRLAVVGTVALLLAMVVLLLFASATGLPGGERNLPALVFTWFSLFAFMATTALLMSSVFFQRPLDLRNWLTAPVDGSSASEEAPAPLPVRLLAGSDLPIGVTSQRQTTSQVEVRVEVKSTGILRSYFFQPDAELRTVAAVIMNDLSLSNNQLIGGARYYDYSWAFVDSNLGSQWGDIPDSKRTDYLFMYRSSSNAIIVIPRAGSDTIGRPPTINSANLPNGTVFHVYPVPTGQAVALPAKP